ncbi:MAG: SRPBCC family protein [Pseudomonadota bacterium]
MQITVSTHIDAPRDVVWARATDFENCADFISGLEKTEVLEIPATGIVGLKWQETRTMMGKEATETMWVTAARAPEHYDVEAGSHGCRYYSRISLKEIGDATELTMTFRGEPETFMAKLLGNTIGRLFLGTTRKMLQQDIDDIKLAAEHDAHAVA